MTLGPLAKKLSKESRNCRCFHVDGLNQTDQYITVVYGPVFGAVYGLVYGPIYGPAYGPAHSPVYGLEYCLSDIIIIIIVYVVMLNQTDRSKEDTSLIYAMYWSITYIRLASS